MRQLMKHWLAHLNAGSFRWWQCNVRPLPPPPPRYNRNHGWLGTEHQVTYLLTPGSYLLAYSWKLLTCLLLEVTCLHLEVTYLLTPGSYLLAYSWKLLACSWELGARHCFFWGSYWALKKLRKIQTPEPSFKHNWKSQIWHSAEMVCARVGSVGGGGGGIWLLYKCVCVCVCLCESTSQEEL